MGCLYQLIFPNGKSYIGITAKTLGRRIVAHRSHAKTEKRGALQRAIRKYGDFSARTLVVADDWSYLCGLEKAAIASFGTLAPAGYNLTTGGEGAFGVKLTPKQRQKRSEARKGKGTGNKFALGYRHTPEARAKIAAANRGAVFSPERRAKIGASKLGHKFNVGKSCSEATRDKISKAQKGVPRFTAEQKRHLSEIRKGRPWSLARRAAQKSIGDTQ